MLNENTFENIKSFLLDIETSDTNKGDDIGVLLSQVKEKHIVLFAVTALNQERVYGHIGIFDEDCEDKSVDIKQLFELFKFINTIGIKMVVDVDWYKKSAEKKYL